MYISVCIFLDILQELNEMKLNYIIEAWNKWFFGRYIFPVPISWFITFSLQ